MLSSRLLAILRQYRKDQRPKPYLFPGQRPDQPISPRTVQMVCRRALVASGLSKRINMHALRHPLNVRSCVMPGTLTAPAG
jgi:site-specific recombinase XerD